MKFDILSYIFNGPGRDFISHGQDASKIAILGLNIFSHEHGPSWDGARDFH